MATTAQEFEMEFEKEKDSRISLENSIQQVQDRINMQLRQSSTKLDDVILDSVLDILEDELGMKFINRANEEEQ